MTGAAWLSIADLRARWSCSRTTVYAALGQMQQVGYLRRLWLGRVQRVAVESVERYEAEHAAPPSRAAQLALPILAPPRCKTSTGKARRPGRARASSPGAAIRALKIAA